LKIDKHVKDLSRRLDSFSSGNGNNNGEDDDKMGFHISMVAPFPVIKIIGLPYFYPLVYMPHSSIAPRSFSGSSSNLM
jgi:hypothetical protein